MNVYHTAQYQAAGLLLVALAVVGSPTALAQKNSTECGIVSSIALTVYKGVWDARQHKDEAAAYRLKDLFWSIEKHSDGCERVRNMAEALVRSKLGRHDSFDTVTSNYVGASATGTAGGSSGSVNSTSGSAGGASGTGSTESGGATSGSSGTSTTGQ